VDGLHAVVGFSRDCEPCAGEDVAQGVAHEERVVDDQHSPLGHRFTPPPGCRWPAAAVPDRSASRDPRLNPPARALLPTAPSARVLPRGSPRSRRPPTHTVRRHLSVAAASPPCPPAAPGGLSGRPAVPDRSRRRRAPAGASPLAALAARAERASRTPSPSPAAP